MLANLLVKQSLRRALPRLTAVCKPAVTLTQQPMRTYYQDNVLMPREYGDSYMSDPVATAERIIRVIGLHDALSVDPAAMTVSHSFDQLGLNELDMCEIFLMLEKEFDFEISEEDCEGMTTINDIVEFTSRNFYAK